jgi:hypothetical protein
MTKWYVVVGGWARMPFSLLSFRHTLRRKTWNFPHELVIVPYSHLLANKLPNLLAQSYLKFAKTTGTFVQGVSGRHPCMSAKGRLDRHWGPL